MRYRCPKCGKTLNAHDPHLIQQLPHELQLEFPAVLTHKGGVSKAVADLLRPCIQNSVGPERFRKILRELHHLKHDRLELQYLTSLYNKRKNYQSYFTMSAPQQFSSFNDRSLYAGYVPTAVYFRRVYTAIIDVLRPKMDKHMMILDKKVLKGDHSFKFPKKMAKIEDVSVFSGLYTVTNEYEEIVLQVLVPSKALAYLRYSFQKMRDAYSYYGHTLPVAFFTDNVKGDRSFLEEMFESLTENVEPAKVNSGTADDIQLPNDVEVKYLCRDFEAMENEICNLLEDMKNIVVTDPGTELAVGFDGEWKPYSTKDIIDVVQNSYKKTVYVLHLDRSWSILPSSLKTLLADNKIKKVGKSVGTDIGRIQKAFKIKCSGKLELGTFCAERKCTPNGRTSLSDMCF